MPNQLSGGMRKRAGLARALVLDPGIVLFDEPDSGLDPVRTALLGELIKEVHAENGGCYVVITHDIMSARRVAEHISVLWKGRIVESGPAQDLFASENPFVRQFLSGESVGPLGMGVSSRLLSALAGGAARRPRAVLGRGDPAGRGRRCWRCRCGPAPPPARSCRARATKYRTDPALHRGFGEEPIEVLVKGNLQKLVAELGPRASAGARGCLSGNVPAAALPAEGGVSGPCGKLAAARTIKVVFGPGTFVNEATEVIDEQLLGQTKSAKAQAAEAARVVSRAALAEGLGTARAAGTRCPGPQYLDGPLPGGDRHARAAVRADLEAEFAGHELRLLAGVRTRQARRHAPRKARLPLPGSRSGARHRCG